MESITIALAICASLVQLVGYWIYNKEVFAGRIKPNVSSWFLWGLGSALSAWSYIELSEDWVKSLLPVTCAIVCILTFLFALLRGSYEKPDKYDLSICVLDVLVIGFWFLTESDEYTNLLFQFDVVLSFIPIIRGTWKKPGDEKALPWMIWSFAYVLFLVTVLLRYEKWWDLMYPINYLVLHIAVVFIVVRSRLRKSL